MFLILHDKERERAAEMVFGFKPEWICPYLEVEAEINMVSGTEIKMNCCNSLEVILDRGGDIIGSVGKKPCDYKCVR